MMTMQKKRTQWLSLLLSSVGLMLLGSAAHAQLVNTDKGWVYGNATATYKTWLGIPYAASTGPILFGPNNRWKPPQPVTPWVGIRYSMFAGSICEQAQPPFGLAAGSEDCLFINIGAPANATATSKLPVIVYVHGGAMTGGSGTDPNIDGTVIPGKANVVFVTMNYRVGSLGFLGHAGLFAESGGSANAGNYGLLDVIQALKWIKTNIANFGGDPNHVTLTGGSSGALMVWDLLASSAANGLYARAITESYSPSGAPNVLGGVISAGAAKTQGTTFANAAGCTGSDAAVISCLRGKDPGSLMTAQGITTLGSLWGPVYGGGSLLPRSPYQALLTGNYNHVTMINGTNHDEGRFVSNVQYDLGAFAPMTAAQYDDYLTKTYGSRKDEVLAQYNPADYAALAYDTTKPNYSLAYAAIITDSGFACTARTVNKLIGNSIPALYAYELNDPKAYAIFPHFNYDLGSYHGAEAYYIMQQATAALGGTAEQIALSNQIMTYWGKFAATGSPNGGGGPTWTKYSPSTDGYITFEPAATGAAGTNSRMLPSSTFDSFHKCAFWSTFGI